MLLRDCAGGIVFSGSQVYLLMNDKQEWILPKGIVREDQNAESVAVQRVKMECGVDAKILSKAGATSYEFYSTSRKKPVCNAISWYIMESDDFTHEFNKELGFLDGAFFSIEEAMEKITYSQDKSLLRMAYGKYEKMFKI